MGTGAENAPVVTAAAPRDNEEKNSEKRPIVKNDGKTGQKTPHFDVQPTQ
ncbi:MAG: hypothetical protein J5531_06155 [Lachnospiraceae bacterium]|nr:hypothetical protein [Lachnospiraceae bacterium]